MTARALNMKVLLIQIDLFKDQKQNRQPKAQQVGPAVVLGGRGAAQDAGLTAGKEGVVPAGGPPLQTAAWRGHTVGSRGWHLQIRAGRGLREAAVCGAGTRPFLPPPPPPASGVSVGLPDGGEAGTSPDT